ncbi:MAG TPA: alginate lyase family protein [Solirubrobacterales bacterium]|jgi:hypothetical protein|nr:alginate lyase family protein [Solirubrobacterales bacterium]
MGPYGKFPTAISLAEGRFEVYGQATILKPPIDWLQDPHESRSWCYQLHSLMWLKPLFLAYVETDDRNALAVALDIVADWISAHSTAAASVSEFAWYDMAVSHRATAIAYALRAGLLEGMIDAERANLLLQACNRHGSELADDSKYSTDHNHGLAQDEALHLLARQVPVLPAAPAWADLSVSRLRRTMKATVNEREGGHLEHSTEYQFAITRMVARIAETMPELPELPERLERLRQHSAWHVMPNGRSAQLGDTDDKPAEEWAISEAASQSGMAVFPQTGNAFVRDGDSYLAVSAAYHSSTHKHSDGTGFLLVEGGQVLVGDAGRWGYYEEEPDRLYARSAFAHNVLTVDERDFGWRESKPYGSGLLAAGEGDGWYAILATNPLFAQQGVEHLRLLLYRPGEILVVVDDVRAEEPHDYARRFHFGPEIEARLDERGHVIAGGEGVTATLTDLDAGTEIALDRGRDVPTRLGWTYPSDRKRVPVWTATMRSRAADATMTAVLRIGQADRAARRLKTTSS